MDKLHAGLAIACAVGIIAAARAVVEGSRWEQRVAGAEARAAVLQGSVDSLEHVASVAEASAAHTDTVRVTLTKLIPQTDSVSHPDSSCAPSLAARDRALHAAESELTQWELAFHAQVDALSRLTAEKNTLKSALDARPRAGAVLELLHPSLHISLQAMLYPEPRIGIGVSIDLVRVRL